MVVDPFTALGLAGNIIQFIDLCSKLVSKSRQIYRSGASTEVVDLGLVANSISELSESISLQENSPDVQAWQKGAAASTLSSCKEVADELLHTIEKLKTKSGSHRKWSSFRQALMVMWKAERIDRLERRLSSLQSELGLQIMSLMNGKISTLHRTVQNLQIADPSLQEVRAREIENLVQSVKSEKIGEGTRLTKEDLDQFYVRILGYYSEATKISKEQAILESLCFESMAARHSKVAEAHGETYSWIFRTPSLPSSDVRSRVKFTEWLQSPDQIYWISGKPGCGKSTLMKYLHPKSKLWLECWAGSSRLVTAHFYFWNSGTVMQKSQQGLLQSLLFEILHQCPDLIISTCSDRYQSDRTIKSKPWTHTELSQCLKQLKKQQAEGIKYCFFIDGLDEYDGDPFELIETINDLVDSPCIKLCISSRNLSWFEDSFGKTSNRKLYLQDYTREDISRFARCELEQHITAAVLRNSNRAYQELIEDIVDLAQGVFLWVALVVRSLRDGLSNSDSIHMLHIRLHSLPTELEPFFKHMLKSVDSVYQRQMALTFQVALKSAAINEPFHAMACSFLEDEEEEPDFAIRCPVKAFDDIDIKRRMDRLRRFLNGRYKGLLEICITIFSNSPTSLEEKSKIRHESSIPFDPTIEFIHRTFRDFLLSKDIQSLLNGYLGPISNPCTFLTRARLAVFKTRPEGQQLSSLSQVISAALQAELESGQADVGALDELKRVVEDRLSEFRTPDSFLQYLTRNRLTLYVERQILRIPSLVEVHHGLLANALQGWLDAPEQDYQEMVQMLLNHGANPNHKYTGYNSKGPTIWQWFCYAYPSPDCKNEHQQETWRKYARLLLVGGADINNESTWYYLLQNSLSDLRVFEGSNKKSSELYKALELFFAHGADPNRRIQKSSPWQHYLTSVEDVRKLKEMRFLMEPNFFPVFIGFLIDVAYLFLLHGANPRLVFVFQGDSHSYASVKTVKRTLLHTALTLDPGADIDRLSSLLHCQIQNAEAEDLYHGSLPRKPRDSEYDVSSRYSVPSKSTLLP